MMVKMVIDDTEVVEAVKQLMQLSEKGKRNLQRDMEDSELAGYFLENGESVIRHNQS